MNSIILKAYSYKGVRYIFKFSVSFVGIKLIYDSLIYCIFSKDVKDSDIKFARFFKVYANQSPLNPPTPSPYQFFQNYQDLKNWLNYNNLQHRMYDIYNFGYIQRLGILNDHPMRQNSDIVDCYWNYSKYIKRDNFNKIDLLKKIKQQGGTIPEGINKKIRQLQQYTLEDIKPITPML